MRNLEEVLDELRCFGNPSLRFSSITKAWHCSLEVFVTGQVISFDITSDKQETPGNAAFECLRRLEAALNSINSQRPALKG